MFSISKLLYTSRRPLSTLICSSIINPSYTTAAKGPFYYSARNSINTSDQPSPNNALRPPIARRNTIERPVCPVCKRPPADGATAAKKKGPNPIVWLVGLIGRLGLAGYAIALTVRLGVWRPLHPQLNSAQVVAKELDELVRDIQLALSVGENGK